MARYTGPKLRLARRVGQDLNLKQNPQKTARRIANPPGQHGQKGRHGRRQSDYGRQLLEKQKVKYVYGVLEKQFRRYVQQAKLNPQATGEELLRILECRLDNAVYRLGFAPTRAMARQMVTHGHIQVNGKKVDIPSFQIRINDVISLNPKALNIPDVKRKLDDKGYTTPEWMQKKGAAGKITRLPARSDVDANIDEQLIVEYYSR